MILYRPVGLQELALIYDSGMKAFPARLPQQPIFYPVLDPEYARQVASSWNAKNGQLAGYVTRFKVEDDYIGRFEEHTVGGTQHQEFWIPAEELEEFNKQIVGHIKVVEAHFGDAFEGFVPDQFALQGKNAVEQFTLLANSYLYKRMEFYLEIKRNHKAVFLNFPFWQTYEFKNPGLKEKIIKAIREAWFSSFPNNPLPNPLQEEAAAVTPADSEALDGPAPEDTAGKQTPVPRLVRPVPKETPPVRQTYANSLVKPVREDPPPPKRRTPQAQQPVQSSEEETPPAGQPQVVNPIEEEETAPREQPELEAQAQQFGEHAEQETPPDSPALENPVPAESRPVEQPRARAQHWVTPARKEPALPAPGGSHFLQGVRLGLNGEYRAAVNELSRAVEDDPEDVSARTSLGVAFRRLGEDDRALDCYEAALQIDPANAEAYYFHANILHDRREIREAITGYTLALGLQPDLIESHEKPAPQDRLVDYSPVPSEMYRIARPARRIIELNGSLEANPRQANLFKERAAEYSRLWNYEQAIADYSSALALQPDDASALHARGVAYEQLGQHDRAQADFQQAAAGSAEIANEYIQRGVTFGKAGSFRQAIASLTEGIRLAPQNPDGYFNRGASHFQLGDLEKAIEDFSHVIRLSPKDDGAYYWRGISHEQAGRQPEAVADYKEFLSLSQDPQARQEVEQRLRQWDAGKPDEPGSARDLLGKLVSRVRGRTAVADEKEKTEQAPPEKPDPDLDIHDLLVALGERAANSIWFGSNVECYGEKAEELYARTRQDQSIEGRELLSITEGIRQTVQGDFYALDPDAPSHWLFLHAWEGNGFYIETDDAASRQRLKARFPALEEVEGAASPYEGLLIRL